MSVKWRNDPGNRLPLNNTNFFHFLLKCSYYWVENWWSLFSLEGLSWKSFKSWPRHFLWWSWTENGECTSSVFSVRTYFWTTWNNRNSCTLTGLSAIEILPYYWSFLSFFSLFFHLTGRSGLATPGPEMGVSVRESPERIRRQRFRENCILFISYLVLSMFVSGIRSVRHRKPSSPRFSL